MQSRQTCSSATIGRGFRQTCPHASPTGAFIKADFFTHLFVDRQLSIPVVLSTTVNSVWKTHGRQKAVDPLWASGSKHSPWKDPRPQPSYGLLIAIAFKTRPYDTAPPPSYLQPHDGGGTVTLSTFDGTLCPSHSRRKQVIMTPNIGSLPKIGNCLGTKALLTYCVSRSRY